MKFPFLLKIVKQFKAEFRELASRPRGIFLLTFFLTIPLFGVIYWGYLEVGEIREMREQVEELRMRCLRFSQTKQSREIFSKSFMNADPQYVHHLLEPYAFNQAECKKFELLLQNPSFTNNVELREKVKELSGESNHLFFQEKSRVKGSYFEEIQYHQPKRVKASFADCETILALIEKENQNKPEIVITKWEMEKTEENGIYYLKMDLLQKVPF